MYVHEFSLVIGCRCSVFCFMLQAAWSSGWPVLQEVAGELSEVNQ